VTDDQIIEMAKQAMHSAGIKPNDELRFYVSYNNGIDDDGFCARAHSFIEDFARLIEASVREEDVKKVAEFLSNSSIAEQVMRGMGK
jgi:hypothetical protein